MASKDTIPCSSLVPSNTCVRGLFFFSLLPTLPPLSLQVSFCFCYYDNLKNVLIDRFFLILLFESFSVRSQLCYRRAHHSWDFWLLYHCIWYSLIPLFLEVSNKLSPPHEAILVSPSNSVPARWQLIRASSSWLSSVLAIATLLATRHDLPMNSSRPAIHSILQIGIIYLAHAICFQC